ncbi:MAG: hypothetical protein U0936_24395 [Planctomycetaceae bacterium]
MACSELLVHSLVCCERSCVTVAQTTGDGRLTIEIGEHRQHPDFHLQLQYAGRNFNLVFEVDNATEPIDSGRDQRIRNKILGYENYQDWVLRTWQQHGAIGHRPAFRVVFLTSESTRAYHILSLASQLS